MSEGLKLITGGSGYLGSYLLRRVLERSDRARVFDLNDADDRPPSVEFVRGDIRDEGAIARACEGVDTVYHAVAQVPLARDRALFESVNIRGTQALLEAAVAAGVRKVVSISSSAVYGVPARLPVTEDTIPTPAEAYGSAKYEGERLCAKYARTGLDVSVVRPRTIVGHGRLGIFQILFEWIRQGANVPVLGRGDNVYQFVHVADLADACIRTAERPGPTTYNCGADRYGTMRQVLQRRYEKRQAMPEQLPDLILIDGGKGQLGIALEVLEGLNIPTIKPQLRVFGVAKGAERRSGYEDIIDEEMAALNFPMDSPALLLIHQIREEAHRIAITGHRQARAKTRRRSRLEEIPGIGVRKRQMLLNTFGGLQGVQSAGVEELMQIKGINRETAQAIYDSFHG